MSNFSITVFTPTFNRVNELKRLYESLKLQSYKNFTWLVVDDGSTDLTGSFIEQCVKENYISIDYIYCQNGGKQRAYNIAIEHASSDLFICIDSDDIYIPEAFEVIVDNWSKITNRDEFVSISYLSGDLKGNLIGSKFPDSVHVGRHFDIHNRFDVRGDKGMAFNTKILRKFRFPVFPDEKFTTEALLYNRMSIKYKTFYINRILEIKEYLIDGLSDKYQRLLIDNPKSSATYYNEFFLHELSLKMKIKAKTNYFRYQLHQRHIALNRTASMFFGLNGFCFVLAYILYLKDLKRK